MFFIEASYSRYILLQFLILFQYLKSNVKFKTDTQVSKSHPLDFFPKLKLKLPTLNSSWTGQSHLKCQFNRQTLDTSQTKCVEEMQSKVYRLLGETPPNGPEFAKSVKRILGREEAWNRY